MFMRPSVAPDSTSAAQFALDVEYYLAQQPRQLPSRYLYDPLGSALFDAICHLPWYRITRAEIRLLAGHGRAIFDAWKQGDTIVELGGGNGEKLVTLVEAGPELFAMFKPKLREYATMLLSEIEQMYVADVGAGKKGEDLQNRLKESLECARRIYGQRVAMEGPAAAAVATDRRSSPTRAFPSHSRSRCRRPTARGHAASRARRCGTPGPVRRDTASRHQFHSRRRGQAGAVRPPPPPRERPDRSPRGNRPPAA